MGIGFMKSSQADIKNEETRITREFRDLREIHQLLNKEQEFIQKAANNMIREINVLKDLEKNFASVKNQENSLIRLVENKAKLIQKYHEEFNKQVKDIDALQQIISLMRRMEAQIFELYDAINKEIQRLIINETHELYKESEQNTNVMKKISKDARELKSNIDLLINKHYLSNKELSNLERELEIMREQRQQKKAESDMNKIGFR